MKTINFRESSIVGQYAIDLRDKYFYNFTDSKTADMYRLLFVSMADIVKFMQSKNNPRVGISLKDDKGNFKLGMILTFTKPEDSDEEDSGNWNLEATFNQDDMTDLDVDLDNHSDIFVQIVGNESAKIIGGRFSTVEYMFNMFITAVDCLTKFLDANATEDGVELVLDNIFVASACIEDGQKYMSIVPGSYIKQLVKNDAAL